MPKAAKLCHNEVEIRIRVPKIVAAFYDRKGEQHFMSRNSYVQRLILDHYRRQEHNGNTR